MQMPGWRGGDGNAAYLDKTLRHGDIELALGESISWKIIFQLWLRAFIASVLVAVIPLLIGTLSLISAAGQSSYYGGSDDSSGGGWLVFGFIASGVVFWLVLLMSRMPEPIAAWRVLLADREDRAASVYSQIRGSLRARRSPLRVQERRMRTGPAGAADVSNRLVLSDGPYTAYVSVFRYGTSLYLGWMMWRSRRGATLMAQFLGDLIRGVTGHNAPEEQMMRADRPQAMREAVHLACREGLVVAIEGIDVPDAYGFPQGLPPIEDVVVPAPPPPGHPVQPAPGHAPPFPGQMPAAPGQAPPPASAPVPPPRPDAPQPPRP
ncbi:hypothetical protein [Streptomyces sp. 8N706]|uniref:hypothetical protein n=1 Tax=Streptomyces sp. 8N706 TaxID=3457416 RepID=UPI003FD32CDC